MKLYFCGCFLAIIIIQLALSQAAAAGVFNLVVENDAFAKTDRHYTSGILLNYVSDRNGTPDLLRRFGNHLPAVDPGDQVYTGLHLGQQIFTPDNIHTEQLVADERPYAGYLAGGVSLLAVSPGELDVWRLSLGVVGPKAHGEEFQTSIHSRIGANLAQGWHNQLGNETILQVNYHRAWQEAWTYAGDGLAADIVPYAGVALGNAAVHADAGVTLRLGEGLASDFGPPRMRPGIPGSAFFDSQRSRGWYFFLGFAGRYVAHDIFLDGNTNGASHRVDKNNWVGDVQAGWVFNTQRYRIAYTFVARSREYETQKFSDQFGSLTLSFKF